MIGVGISHFDAARMHGQRQLPPMVAKGRAEVQPAGRVLPADFPAENRAFLLDITCPPWVVEYHCGCFGENPGLPQDLAGIFQRRP